VQVAMWVGYPSCHKCMTDTCCLVTLQEKLKELEEKVSRSNGSESWVLERTWLKSALEDKSSEMERLKKEADMTADQMEHLRKEVDM